MNQINENKLLNIMNEMKKNMENVYRNSDTVAKILLIHSKFYYFRKFLQLRKKKRKSN